MLFQAHVPGAGYHERLDQNIPKMLQFLSPACVFPILHGVCLAGTNVEFFDMDARTKFLLTEHRNSKWAFRTRSKKTVHFLMKFFRKFPYDSAIRSSLGKKNMQNMESQYKKNFNGIYLNGGPVHSIQDHTLIFWLFQFWIVGHIILWIIKSVWNIWVAWLESATK